MFKSHSIPYEILFLEQESLISTSACQLESHDPFCRIMLDNLKVVATVSSQCQEVTRLTFKSCGLISERTLHVPTVNLVE